MENEVLFDPIQVPTPMSGVSVNQPSSLSGHTDFGLRGLRVAKPQAQHLLDQDAMVVQALGPGQRLVGALVVPKDKLAAFGVVALVEIFDISVLDLLIVEIDRVCDALSDLESEVLSWRSAELAWMEAREKWEYVCGIVDVFNTLARALGHSEMAPLEKPEWLAGDAGPDGSAD